MSPPIPAKMRIGELDALRGLAAVAVMVFHYTGHYGKDIGHLDPPPFELPMGNYGVQLFFMISGFVIFMTLEKTRSAMDFVVTRFSRLYPAYWAALAISALFVYTIGMPSQRLPLTDLAANLTMLQELLRFRHLDGAYWTLQIELLFYAQMLCWFLFGQLGRAHWIIAAWLVVALAYTFIPRLLGMNPSWTVGELLIVEHIPFFGLGILFYRIHKGEKNLVNHVLIAACIAVIALTRPPIFLPVALFCTTVFYLFILGQLRWLQSAPFTFLGTISYSLYLLHQAIGFDIIWHLERDAHVSSGIAIVVAIAVILVLSSMVTFLVEKPAMRWIRERWKNRALRTTPQSA